ncbi:MAG: serine/threonine protein kinase [Planctomycetota bacterium]|jgi:serine/threonine protein kinase
MNRPALCPECNAPIPQSPSGSVLYGMCAKCILRRHMSGTPDLGKAGKKASETPAPDLSDVQRDFPQLEILELVGRGGMGLVYKARQKSLGRVVALKVLAPLFANDPAFAERFLREAQALAKLSHPHIVTVFEFGERQGRYFIVMEFVEGKSMRELLNDRKVGQADTLRLVPQICDGLQYAHEHGVVHRDIKPENILVDLSGDVRIADFGLARLLGANEEDWRLTRASQVMGTPQYMAPEQMSRPTEVDHRVDIYALGAVMYEMLTGELPMGRFALPSEESDTDKRLDEVILTSLASDPKRRYQSVHEMGAAVNEVRVTPIPNSATGKSPTTEGIKQDARKIAFKNDDRWGGLMSQYGLIGLEQNDLVLEYRERDCLGLRSSAPRILRIPLTQISLAAFSRNWFGGHSIWITANSMASFGEFPEHKPCVIRLMTESNLEPLAKKLTDTLQAKIESQFAS